MKLIRFFLLTLAIVLSGASAHAEMNVMGYQAWKMSRIEEARGVVERLLMDAQVDKSPALDRSVGDKGGAGRGPELKKADTKGLGKSESPRLQRSVRGDQRLEQAQLNLEIALEFSVNDYFVLYLSQFKEKEAFVEAAKKLSADETADLMIAYQKSMNGSEQSESSAPSQLAPSAITVPSAATTPTSPAKAARAGI